MSILKFLISLVPSLLSLVFNAEKTFPDGETKEGYVIKELAPILIKAGTPVDIIKYTLIAIKVIRFVVDLLNKEFGKDWGKKFEDPDDK